MVDSLEQADMGVSFTVSARDKTRVTQTPTMTVANSWRWGGQYWAMNTPIYTESTRVYSEGTIATDVFDTSRNAPVWHGVSSKTLPRAEKTASQEFVNGAVTVTLQSFPAKK